MLLLLSLTALLLGSFAHAQESQLYLAKLHATRNSNLCVGLSDGTYNRDIVLRPCSHDSAIWSIRKDEGSTFMRHKNVCLNGGFMKEDWGFNIVDGNPTYGQFCQDEALRWGWDMFNGIVFPGVGTGFPAASSSYPCLDLKDGKLYDGAKLQIWECHKNGHPDYDNQKWNIEWLGQEYPSRY